MTMEANNEDLMKDTDSQELILTTIDNPHNPKTEYVKWKIYDRDHGYHTEEYVARLLSMEEEYDAEDEIKLNVLTDKVINDILENDMLGLYKLV